MSNQIEPLLQEVGNRYVLFPIRYQPVWQMYKKALSAFWTAEEIDLSKDLDDWNKLSNNERVFIKNILAFFAASDGIVNENLATRFMNEVQVPEVKCFYGFQIAMENVHSETYSLLLETYIKDSAEKAHILDAIQTIPCIKRKAEWALKWISDENSSFAVRLIAFAAVEGIFFSGSFCAIFWLKERGVMPGLCSSNEFISRDESLHTEFAILLYSFIKDKIDQKLVHQLIHEAVEIENDFINNSIRCNMLGMNRELMFQYIMFVADRLLVQLGYEKLYNFNNPFHFMERISLNNKSNFFEHTRVSEYAKARVGTDQSLSHEFSLNADF